MIAKSILSAIALTLSLASASSIASDVGVGHPGGLCFEYERGFAVRVDCSKRTDLSSTKDSGYRMSEGQLGKIISEFSAKQKNSLPELGVTKPFDHKDLGLLRNDFYKPYGTQPTLVR